MIDQFAHSANSLTAPCREGFSITPNDTAILPQISRAIYIGGGGDLVVRFVDGTQDVVLRNTISGSILDLRVSAVRQTGTTATDIVGLA